MSLISNKVSLGTRKPVLVIHLANLHSFVNFCLDDTSDAPVAVKNVRKSIGMSWENVSITPRRLKKELDFEKPEIIRDEEIPPNDYSAEAVAKSLLQVSSFLLLSKLSCTETSWLSHQFLLIIIRITSEVNVILM